jgi:hypothetical protein
MTKRRKLEIQNSMNCLLHFRERQEVTAGLLYGTNSHWCLRLFVPRSEYTCSACVFSLIALSGFRKIINWCALRYYQKRGAGKQGSKSGMTGQPNRGKLTAMEKLLDYLHQFVGFFGKAFAKGLIVVVLQFCNRTIQNRLRKYIIFPVKLGLFL